VAGVAAVGAPLLLLASPASAAQASDDDTASALFTNAGGGTNACAITAHHDVDTATGQLSISFVTENNFACNGTIVTDIHYVDRSGRAAHAGSTTRGSTEQRLDLDDAGRTAVTVDYTITFDGCVQQCTHTLRTSTK
jgi:hypothetical protein